MNDEILPTDAAPSTTPRHRIPRGAGPLGARGNGAPDPLNGAEDAPVANGTPSVPEPQFALSQIDWADLRAQAQRTLDQRIPPTPEHQRLGIQDISRVTNLSVQQIRLLEHHGLVRPAFETSGEKRNRRYTRQQAVLILLAAEVMHRLDIRPGKAAMLVLARNLDLDQAAPAEAPESPATHGNGFAAALPPPTARHDLTSGRPVARSTPGLDLFDVADVKVRRVIAARLAATAVSSLLGERDLPPQWVIHARRATCEPDAAVTALGPDGTSQFVSLHVTRIDALDPLRSAADDMEAPFFAFVAREGEVFSFSPFEDLDGQELLHDREWYAVTLPVGDSHPAVDVVLGIPQHHPSGAGLPEAARRLMNDRLPVRRSVVDVAAALLWTVVEIIPDVIRTQSQLARDGAIDLEVLAQHGVTSLVLWLYACVLVRMCPGVDQCDVLTPDQDVDGSRPVLRIIATSNLEEFRASTRAAIPGGQLLSGFAFSLAQPCYVEDVRGPYSVLLSFHRQEHARAAAAIPVTHDGRTHACIYLSSRRGKISFTPHGRRALEVAADEIAEVLLLHDVGWRVSSESILHAVRPNRIDGADALQEVVRAWVEGLAEAQRTRSTSAPSSSDEGIATTDHDDRRLVMVVIRAEVDPHFREQPEIASWLDEVARQSADSLAEALDAGAIDDHPPRPLLEADSEGEGEDEHPSLLTRVFRWQVRGAEAYGGSASAYVILAGDHRTRRHVEHLKDLLRKRGLDGEVTAQTEMGASVGRILGWVLDVKRSVVQLSLRQHERREAGRPDTRPAVQRILRDVHSCVRLLPLQHQFTRQAFREGNLERAIVILKQALTLSPHDSYVVRHLLDLYVRTGRLDEAIILAQENKDHEDGMPAKWFCSLGQVHLMLGDHDEAIKQFEQAIKRDPSHPWAYRLIAEAHMAQGELRAAEEWLRNAIDREETRSMRKVGQIIDTRLLLGDVLAQQGKLEAAIAAYEELLILYSKKAKYNVLVSQRLAAARWQRRVAAQARTQPHRAK
jgi:predicted negative regulator of RcsB-dependent stress response